jgi:hypothetical protein
MEEELLHLTLDGYLGCSFCRQNQQNGGVCIFVKKDKSFKEKLIFLINVQNKIWKSLLFNYN